MLFVSLMSLALGSSILCDGEHETPQCAAELVAQASRRLSLPDIHAEFDRGSQVYRATFDGGAYGRPAVSFERQPGRNPEVVIYGPEGRTLRREIGTDVWEAVRARSRYVGRRLEPIAGYSVACIVSSDVVVQISIPERRLPDQTDTRLDFIAPGRGAVTEASQNSCEGGLTWDFGVFLADLACEEIPECDAMGPRDEYMVAVQNLEASFGLSGDRLAAASLSAGRGQAPSRGGHEQPVVAARFANWLEPQNGATLDWGGVVVQARRRYDDPNPDTISQFLAEQDVAADGLAFRPAEFDAESAEVASVTGTVEGSIEVSGEREVREAPYRQTWLRKGGSWRLWSMTVGPFERRARQPDLDEPF